SSDLPGRIRPVDPLGSVLSSRIHTDLLLPRAGTGPVGCAAGWRGRHRHPSGDEQWRRWRDRPALSGADHHHSCLRCGSARGVLAGERRAERHDCPVFVSALYILRGIQLRPRYTVIGLVLGTLCLGGYLFLLPVFWPWMAMACGGTLILAGLWLRSH